LSRANWTAMWRLRFGSVTFWLRLTPGSAALLEGNFHGALD
jgi:hypothetical protein